MLKSPTGLLLEVVLEVELEVVLEAAFAMLEERWVLLFVTLFSASLASLVGVEVMRMTH